MARDPWNLVLRTAIALPVWQGDRRVFVRSTTCGIAQGLPPRCTSPSGTNQHPPHATGLMRAKDVVAARQCTMAYASSQRRATRNTYDQQVHTAKTEEAGGMRFRRHVFRLANHARTCREKVTYGTQPFVSRDNDSSATPMSTYLNMHGQMLTEVCFSQGLCGSHGNTRHRICRHTDRKFQFLLHIFG